MTFFVLRHRPTQEQESSDQRTKEKDKYPPFGHTENSFLPLKNRATANGFRLRLVAGWLDRDRTVVFPEGLRLIGFPVDADQR